jgi:ribosome-binding factor A
MAKPQEVRVLQVSKQVLESLSRYVGSRSTWGVPGYITLTRVRMSKDLKNAKVGVRLVEFDTEKEPNHKLAAEALQAHVQTLQHHLAKDLKLRFTPKLQFVVDESWDQILKVENALKELELAKKVAAD